MAETTLTAANEVVHERLLADYDGFLEALTSLDLEAARIRLDAFERRLLPHMELEDGEVNERFRVLDGDPDAELRRLAGDHAIIRRGLDKVRAALVALGGSPEPRRELVRRLGVFSRLRDVLEHHTVRESTRIYPRLDEVLAPGARRELVGKLLGSAGEAAG